MNQKVLWLVILVLFAGFVFWLVSTPGKAGKLDTFATCVKDSGAEFYGAFWCPHCQNQKALFGSSAKLLPYIECSTPDSQGMLPVCKEAGITGFPTWKFGTSTVVSGEVSLARLAELTNCPLPVTQ